MTIELRAKEYTDTEGLTSAHRFEAKVLLFTVCSNVQIRHAPILLRWSGHGLRRGRCGEPGSPAASSRCRKTSLL